MSSAFDAPVCVSVIIPCYNVEKYLRECLDSVVNQTLKEIEIICVDDGSTDSTPQILEEYAAKDARIKILYQKNQFAGVARNNGMKIARGKYLSFLDSDDFFELEMLENMVRRAEEVDADVVVCDFRNLYEGKSKKDWTYRIGSPEFRGKKVFSAEECFSKLSLGHFAQCPWNKLFRREFIAEIKNEFLSIRSSNDLTFVDMALASANRISICPHAFINYRRNAVGAISSTRGRNWESNITAWRELHVRLKNKGLYEKFRRALWEAQLNSHIYEIRNIGEKAEEYLHAIYSTFSEMSYGHRVKLEREGLGKIVSPAPTPIVSIVIPVYNTEKYLRSCLDSVVNQTLCEIEIICVDDGSTDSSMEILEEYAQRDPRVKLVRQENSGQGTARNNGIKIAKGAYIGFVDSDDWVSDSFFETLLAIARENNADIALTTGVLLTDGGEYEEVKSTGLRADVHQLSLSDRASTILATGITVNKLYLREFLLKNDIWFPRRRILGEDNVVTILSVLNANKVVATHDVKYYYRQRPDSTVNQPASPWFFTIADVYRLIFDKIRDENIDAFSIAKKRAIQDCGLAYKRFSASQRMAFAQIVRNKLPEIRDELSFLRVKDLKVVVSLTSFPARINTIHLTVESLLAQTWSAGRIVLWLAESQFPQKELDLPKELLAQKERGLEIRWCEDLRSFKKLIPALKAFPKDIIVTVDDDLILEPTWLDSLIVSYLMNPSYIHTHRAHGIVFSNHKTIAPYKVWENEIKTERISFNNFLTGGGGCLYPPNSLHKDVFEVAKFQELCPHGDDIWFWAMAVLAGTKICVTPSAFRLKYSDGTQEVGLWRTVNSLGENDRALQRVLAAYPEILPKLERIPVGGFASSPKILNSAKSANPRPSVVIPAKSSQKQLPCLLVRLGALFIFNKQARKRWRERHMDLTPKDGIDVNAHPELRRDSALKRFIVRLGAAFILNKEARKRFRAKHLNLRPRDGVDVRALSREGRRVQEQKKRDRNPLRRLFNALIPVTRSKIAHVERHLLRDSERRTERLLAELRASQKHSNRRFDEVVRELARERERTAALERKLNEVRDCLVKKTDALGAKTDELRNELSRASEKSTEMLTLNGLAVEQSTRMLGDRLSKLQEGIESEKNAVQTLTDSFREAQKTSSDTLNALDKSVQESLSVVRPLDVHIASVEKGISEHLSRCAAEVRSEVGVKADGLQKTFTSGLAPLSKILKNMDELSWAAVFNSTISGASWLRDKAFSPGRWAVGYPFLYVLFRVLNEGTPDSILEMGLGQSTRMTAQYAATHPKVVHTVVEHDKSWAQFFSLNYTLPKNSDIVCLDLQTDACYGDDKAIVAYKGFSEKFCGKKFDLICIDGPFGYLAKIYARADILPLLPECLKDSFVILIDDFERKGEQATVGEMTRILREHGIAFCEGTYSGAKQLHIIVSPDKKFLCSL